MKLPNILIFKLVAIVFLCLLVANCGGGGGTVSPDSLGGSGAPDSPDNGGGNDSPDNGGVTVPPEDAAKRKEIMQKYREYMNFDNQPALKLIKADIAYANLETAKGSGLSDPNQAPTIRPGAGVTIGLIDSGIDTQHPVFAGVKVEEQFYPSNYDDEISGGRYSHGTKVASVIASAPQASGVLPNFRFGGIAWGVQIKMHAIQLRGSRPEYYVPSQLTDFRAEEEFFSDVLESAINGGIDILNLSISYSGMIEYYNERSLRVYLPNIVRVLAQARSADKVLLVWSAGNVNNYRCQNGLQHCSNNRLNAISPELNAGLMVLIPELRGHSVAVVSVDPKSGKISSYSNRCGVAKEWCIAAPGGEDKSEGGEGITIALYRKLSLVHNAQRGVEVRAGTGTSFAAPFVAGGLAVMKQIFRGQLSNTALLQRLYTTANKSGRYANQNIYGQGLMDLGKATSPQGQQTLATGNTVGDGGINLQNTNLSASSAFGDSLQQALAHREIVAFDSLGAPFWYKLSSFVQQKQDSHHLSNRLRHWDQKAKSKASEITTLSFASDILGLAASDSQVGQKFKIGLLQTKPNLDIGQLSLAENALGLSYEGSDRISLSAYTTLPTRNSLPITGLAFAWRMKSSPLAFRVARLRESESVLGLQSEGAFGSVSSNSITAGVVSGFNLLDWHIETEAEVGRATPSASGGVISGMGKSLTTGFAVHGTKLINRNKRITLGISQSMRMEKSVLNLIVPNGRTKDGKVIRSDISANVKPTGRQVDLSLNWEHATSDLSGFMLEGVYRRNAGHSANSPPGFLFTAGWRQQF